MAAGNFVSEDVDQIRNCAQDILAMLSENSDAERANKEGPVLNSKVEQARGLEKQLVELQTELDMKRSQQLEDKEKAEKQAFAVSKKLGIMRHILPGVVLDPNSQQDHVRGYIKTTADVKTFDFDTTRVSTGTITDYFWESV